MASEPLVVLIRVIDISSRKLFSPLTFKVTVKIFLHTFFIITLSTLKTKENESNMLVQHHPTSWIKNVRCICRLCWMMLDHHLESLN